MLRDLYAALDEDRSLAAPVCEAIEKLPLSAEARRGAVDAMAQRLALVAAADLSDVAAFVLRECSAGEHALAAVKVRAVVFACACPVPLQQVPMIVRECSGCERSCAASGRSIRACRQTREQRRRRSHTTAPKCASCESCGPAFVCCIT